MNNELQRNIRLGLTIAAMILQAVPKDNIYASIAVWVFTVAVVAWGFWKNNSFTEAAKIGDAIMQEYKDTGILSATKMFDLALETLNLMDEDEEEDEEDGE